MEPSRSACASVSTPPAAPARSSSCPPTAPPSARPRLTRCAPLLPSIRCQTVRAASLRSRGLPPSPWKRLQARIRPALLPTLVALGFAVLAALAALPVRAQQKAPPVVLLFDEQENVKEKRSDTDGDGRYDEYVF